MIALEFSDGTGQGVHQVVVNFDGVPMRVTTTACRAYNPLSRSGPCGVCGSSVHVLGKGVDRYLHRPLFGWWLLSHLIELLRCRRVKVGFVAVAAPPRRYVLDQREFVQNAMPKTGLRGGVMLRVSEDHLAVPTCR